MDELDEALVRILGQDGRRSNVDLATDLGVSEKTVRSRLKRLVAQGLKVTAHLPEPTSSVQMVYVLHAAPGRRFALSEELAAHPAVTRVLLTNGFAELIVSASFHDDDAALRFLVETLEGSADVRDSAASTVISEVGASRPASDDAQVPAIDQRALLEAVMRPANFRELPAFLDWMATTARKAFSADHAMGLVFDVTDGNADDLEPGEYMPTLASATSGLPAGYLETMRSLMTAAKQTGVIRHAFQTRQHVFVDDALNSPLMRGTEAGVRPIGYRSMLATPMLFGSVPFGICTTYYDSIIRLDAEYVSALQNWVDQCSVTIARIDPSVLPPQPS